MLRIISRDKSILLKATHRETKRYLGKDRPQTWNLHSVTSNQQPR